NVSSNNVSLHQLNYLAIWTVNSAENIVKRFGDNNWNIYKSLYASLLSSSHM
ncbi:22659_t:CDS:1, partial [Racocetra persica]